MWLRDLIFKDWGLKLLSLALAVLIWVTVSFAIRKESSPARVFYVPVTPMSAVADLRECYIKPDHITVTVRGEIQDLDKVQEADIHAFVDLTDVESLPVTKRRVQVSVPLGFVLARMFPEEVEVTVVSTKPKLSVPPINGPTP